MGGQGGASSLFQKRVKGSDEFFCPRETWEKGFFFFLVSLGHKKFGAVHFTLDTFLARLCRPYCFFPDRVFYNMRYNQGALFLLPFCVVSVGAEGLKISTAFRVGGRDY